jgi:hypothetical protein
MTWAKDFPWETQRNTWAETIRGWSKLHSFSEAYFVAAADIMAHSWTNDKLIDILAGSTGVDFVEAAVTTEMRLKELESLGKLQQCLNLAKHSKLPAWICKCLIELGHFEEATEEALKSLENRLLLKQIAETLISKRYYWGSYKLIQKAMNLKSTSRPSVGELSVYLLVELASAIPAKLKSPCSLQRLAAYPNT